MVHRNSTPALPPPPKDLVAVAVGSGQVILAWTEGAAGALGFRIERATGDIRSPFMEIGGVGQRITAFRDGTVEPGKTYSYRVHAWNASGKSLPSNVAKADSPQAGTDPAAD